MWLVSVALAAIPDPLATVEAAQQAIFDHVAPAVVYIVTRDGIGSGFFIDADGLILTAGHVVGDAEQVEIIRVDGARLTGVVAERATKADLALVQVSGSGFPWLKLVTDDSLRVGSWVGSVGHGEGGGWTYTTGMVTNLYPQGEDHPVFQTQIPLNPGNSGGPVVDRHGDAVGIVNAGILTAQAINFATRAAVATRTLPMLAGRCDCLVVHAPAGVPVFLDGKMVGTGPVVQMDPANGSHTVFAIVGGKRVEAGVEWPATREVTLQ